MPALPASVPAVAAGEHFTGPAGGHIHVNVELVEDAHHHLVHDVVDGPGVIIEGGHRRDNHHPHPRKLQHVFQVNLAQWRLTYHQHQLAALLEDHVGGAMDQVVAV